jgi:hypothetical protein
MIKRFLLPVNNQTSQTGDMREESPNSASSDFPSSNSCLGGFSELSTQLRTLPFPHSSSDVERVAAAKCSEKSCRCAQIQPRRSALKLSRRIACFMTSALRLWAYIYAASCLIKSPTAKTSSESNPKSTQPTESTRLRRRCQPSEQRPISSPTPAEPSLSSFSSSSGPFSAALRARRCPRRVVTRQLPAHHRVPSVGSHCVL